MAEVVLKSVSKTFDDGTTAVDKVSLTVKDRDFTVLVGPSGCGKSTTLRMIAGLESISEGEIEIDGKTVNKVEPKDRDIAMVFQNYALYPHMTVYDNMAFGLKLRKYKKQEIKERVKEAASILGLENLLDRKPKALSGGQRQRVAVGRAIVRKPKVFLFDEPLSNLDAKLRVQMRTEITRLHDRLGATMIYVTHDQVEAMTMGTSIVVMDKGLVQQIDSPMMLYREPVNKFVAGFIGSPAMNFLKGTLSESGFRSSGGNLEIPHSALRQDLKIETKEVWLGVRPELYSLNENEENSSNVPVTVKTELVEPLGSETLLYFRLEGELMTAKISADIIPETQTELDLFINADKVSFFDAKSGIRFF